MKYAVGYFDRPNAAPGEGFAELVEKFQDHISEVYFPWPGFATGRGDIATGQEGTDFGASGRLLEALKRVKKTGIKLDLLLNGNCYGGDAISAHFANDICSLIEHLAEQGVAPDIVTAASPAVAFILRESFPEIHRRASVNMRTGSVKSMQYLAPLFDSFYMQREYNRDFDRIRQCKNWADKNGKELFLLANSGCMRECSFQTFHDNCVAHGREIDMKKNIDFKPYFCWDFLRNRENWVCLLQNTWIRPEDVRHYEDLTPMMKLATRMHVNPHMVLGAYVEERHRGNLLDLFEPGFSPALAPYYIDNTAFPESWFERTSKCGKNCESCDYCSDVLKQVLKMDDA